MLFSVSSVPLSKSETRSRLMGLAGVTAPIAGAVLYNHGWQISWLVCPLRSLAGIPCPTCGMTRSLMALVRGDLSQAIGYHAFAPLLFLGLLIVALHWLLELGIRRRVFAVYGRWIRDRRRQMGMISGLLLYYAVRLQGWIASGELLAAMQASPIGHWISQW